MPREPASGPLPVVRRYEPDAERALAALVLLLRSFLPSPDPPPTAARDAAPSDAPLIVSKMLRIERTPPGCSDSLAIDGLRHGEEGGA